jgi:hypothetical protein
MEKALTMGPSFSDGHFVAHDKVLKWVACLLERLSPSIINILTFDYPQLEFGS